MKTDDVYRKLTDWLTKRCGILAIRAYQDGERPAGNYLAVTPPIIKEVRQHHHDVVYSEKEGNGFAVPLIEKEWDFSIYSYRDKPEVPLEHLQNLARISSPQNNIDQCLVLFDVGQIKVLPEYIHNKYEQRAQTRIKIRGITQDDLPIDFIEETQVKVTRF